MLFTYFYAYGLTVSLFDSTAIYQNQRGANESEREFLIRTGKITPFAKMSGLEKTSHPYGK
jgi:hypothetical protein